MSAQRNAGGRLRLMFLTERFPPDSGGVATSTLRIAEHLARRDVATTVLTYLRYKSTDLNGPPGFEHVNGADVIRLGPFFKTSGTDQTIALNEKHKAALRRRFVDNAVALIRQMDLRPNLIYHSGHSSNLAHRWCTRQRYWTQPIRYTLLSPPRFILERAARIVVVNRHLQSRMLASFPDMREKSLVINNSIEQAASIDRMAARSDFSRAIQRYAQISASAHRRVVNILSSQEKPTFTWSSLTTF
jgi:hypothetical protein